MRDNVRKINHGLGKAMRKFFIVASVVTIWAIAYFLTR